MKTIISALLGASAATALIFLPASAGALPAPLPHEEEWCPGQPWSAEWGVNEDFEHCHSIDSATDGESNATDGQGEKYLDGGDEDNDTDLNSEAPNRDLGEDLPSDHPDGEYPPNYNWSEKYGDNHGKRHG